MKWLSFPTSTKVFVLIAGLSALLAVACEDESERPSSGPRPAAVGLDKAGHMHLSQGDRCPVCAMDVTQHSKFASAIQLRDGRTYYFCGTGCMIRSWLHPEVFMAVEREELSRAVTKEYFGGRQVDALKAIFVAGSDVVGPMGPALVPLASEADVATFNERHKGKTTFRMGELDDARWKAITGKNAVGAKRR